MEGPLLVVKSWALTALCVWIYQRWFRRVAPASPVFEAFCRTRPVVAALLGLGAAEAGVVERLAQRLGKPRAAVATLGGFPWPHYRLTLAIEPRPGAVLLRVVAAQVVRSGERELPALASLLRDELNPLPPEVEVWLHAGTFNNGLVTVPAGGWKLERGVERLPRFSALEEGPDLASAHLALENQIPRSLPLGTAYTTPSSG